MIRKQLLLALSCMFVGGVLCLTGCGQQTTTVDPSEIQSAEDYEAELMSGLGGSTDEEPATETEESESAESNE